MKRLFLLILMIAPAIGNCQTFTLPISVLDSMLWEIERGRSCESLRVAQDNLIKSQGLELLQTNKSLSLSRSEVKTLTLLWENAKESKEIQGKQSALDLSNEKKKTKKWRRVAVLETLGIVVGLIILL